MNGFNSSNGRFVSLLEAKTDKLGQICNVVGVVTHVEEEPRWSENQRWYRHIKITDPSIYPRTLTINFFHAEAQYLPYLVEHHVLLVRNIKMGMPPDVGAAATSSYDTFLIPQPIAQNIYANPDQWEMDYMGRMAVWSSQLYAIANLVVGPVEAPPLIHAPPPNRVESPQPPSSPSSSNESLPLTQNAVSAFEDIKASRINGQRFRVGGHIVRHQPTQIEHFVVNGGCHERLEERCYVCPRGTPFTYEYKIALEIEDISSPDKLTVHIEGPGASNIFGQFARPSSFEKNGDFALRALKGAFGMLKEHAFGVEFELEVSIDATGARKYNVLSCGPMT